MAKQIPEMEDFIKCQESISSYIEGVEFHHRVWFLEFINPLYYIPGYDTRKVYRHGEVTG